MFNLKKQIADAIAGYRENHNGENPTSARVTLFWKDDEDRDETIETISLVPEEECEIDDDDVVFYSNIDEISDIDNFNEESEFVITELIDFD